MIYDTHKILPSLKRFLPLGKVTGSDMSGTYVIMQFFSINHQNDMNMGKYLQEIVEYLCLQKSR
jgi:hypothetical protein